MPTLTEILDIENCWLTSNMSWKYWTHWQRFKFTFLEYWSTFLEVFLLV